MMAMMFSDNYVARFGLLQTKPAEEVALVLGINEKTVRRLRADWIENNGSFSDSSKGKYRWYIAVAWADARCRGPVTWGVASARACKRPPLQSVVSAGAGVCGTWCLQGSALA